MLFAYCLTVFCPSDYFVQYGYEYYPIGFIFVIMFTFIISYAILKHNLLDINIVIKKGLVYSVSVTLITVLFLVLVIVFERLSQSIFGYESIYFTIFAAVFIALVFAPLRNRIQTFFDHLFYKGTTDEIAQQNVLLRQEVAQAEKFKAVATLASGMAHEIKNPLTAIKTFTEYLPEKKNDPEFLEKFSKLVGKEVDRVDNLVHELLEFAKPAPLTLKDTNIHKLLNETLEFLSNQLIQHNIKVEKNFHSSIENLEADPNQLKQVFLNLILNAIDAMPNGGTLTVGTELKGLKDQRNKGLKEKQKKEQNEKSDNSPLPLYSSNPLILRVSVKDTGTGINKADLKHIFDPFFTKKDNGTGLGLAISYGIIQEHSGDITVESIVNEGTEFCVELVVKK